MTPRHLKPTDTLDFGKYRGKTLEEVSDEDPGYIVWMDSAGIQIPRWFVDACQMDELENDEAFWEAIRDE